MIDMFDVLVLTIVVCGTLAITSGNFLYAVPALVFLIVYGLFAYNDYRVSKKYEEEE